MRTGNEPLAGGVGDAEQDVADYLRAHPGFFLNHPALARELAIPHACGEAVSLVEYQVNALKEQSRALASKLQVLVDNARDNEALGRRIHRLTLSLLECSCLDEIFASLYQSLGDEFQADLAAVRIFTAPRAHGDRGLGEFVPAGMRAAFENVLAAAKPRCGKLETEQVRSLFADRAPDVRSGALVPLGDAKMFGILAICSGDPEHFHAGMGTLFLRQLGELVTRVIVPHLADG